MSTTTEETTAPRGPSWIGPAALAFGVWIAAIVVVTALAEPSRDVLAFGSPFRTIAALTGTDTRILAVGAGHVAVRGGEPGFVRALYAGGAWLVLPGRIGGCRSGATLMR